MAVRITRKDKSAGELRQEAARCRDGKAARRMLAIALVLDGVDRKTAAENCGMDRQTLRDWAHRYNGPKRSTTRAVGITQAFLISDLSFREAGISPEFSPEIAFGMGRMER